MTVLVLAIICLSADRDDRAVLRHKDRISDVFLKGKRHENTALFSNDTQSEHGADAKEYAEELQERNARNARFVEFGD